MKIFSFFLMLTLIPFVKICTPGDESEFPVPQENWEKLGLSHLRVEEINFHRNQLFAATNDGMYKKNVADIDTVWQPIGLQGKYVLDFIVFSPKEILACADRSRESKGVSLYTTNDGGTTWEPYQNDFGIEGDETCQALDLNPMAPDTIFGRSSYAVAKSTDRGTHWTPVYGEWGYAGYQSDLIRIDDQNPNIVWAGGETSIFSPYLLKSTDYGESWEEKPVPSNGDNAVYDMAIKRNDPDVIIVGMEGQLIRSEDGGENFKVVLELAEGTYFLALDRNPVNHGIVYASGSEKGTEPDKLFFYKSRDFGQTWAKVINDEDNVDDIATNDLEAHVVTIRPGLYMGTTKGVWKYWGMQLVTQAQAQE